MREYKNKMSDYNCVGCGNSDYKNKMNGNKGSYSGKDDYASGMPDMLMSDYANPKRNY